MQPSGEVVRPHCPKSRRQRLERVWLDTHAIATEHQVLERPWTQVVGRRETRQNRLNMFVGRSRGGGKDAFNCKSVPGVIT